MAKNSETRNNRTPLVSVIIPVYNVEGYLAECLESVIAQTYKELEIICIDDGATDGSPAILEEFAARDGRVKAIRKENGGLSSARNAGLDAAAGEYAYYLDSDDYIAPNAMERCVEASEAKGLDVLLFDAVSFYENDEVRIAMPVYDGYYTRRNSYEGVAGGMELFTQMVENGEYRTSTCIQFARRQFLARNGLRFTEGILYEDNVYTLKLMLLAEKVAHIPDELFFRRVRADSITSSETNANDIYSLFRTLKYMFTDIAGRDFPPEVQDAVITILREHQYFAASKTSKASEESRQAAKEMIDTHELPEFALLIESMADEFLKKQ